MTNHGIAARITKFHCCTLLGTEIFIINWLMVMATISFNSFVLIRHSLGINPSHRITRSHRGNFDANLPLHGVQFFGILMQCIGD